MSVWGWWRGSSLHACSHWDRVAWSPSWGGGDVEVWPVVVQVCWGWSGALLWGAVLTVFLIRVWTMAVWFAIEVACSVMVFSRRVCDTSEHFSWVVARGGLMCANTRANTSSMAPGQLIATFRSM